MKKMDMRGFSLLELLVVIAILVTLSAVAFLSTDMIRRERVSNATRELYADIQKVRMDSMTHAGKGFGIRIESSNSYVIFEFRDCDGDYAYDTNTCAGGTREENVLVRKNLHSSLALSKTTPYTAVNDDVRIFDRFGTPRRANWGMGTITILVKNVPDTGAIKCVIVHINRIRESVWNGSCCI